MVQTRYEDGRVKIDKKVNEMKEIEKREKGTKKLEAF